MLVGPFEIERELGRGGMGAVYLARDPRSGERVVVKTLAANDPSLLARFEREARIGLALRDPGIVATRAAGRDANGPFLVMEYVAGETLAARLARGPLALREAAALVRDAARALEYAHRSGVVHRDLKPANVLLDAAGRPRIADFGTSRAEGEESVTLTGELVGTPSYLPPEHVADGAQAHGAPGDIWALGAILHAALAGHEPFRAAGHVALLQKILREAPEPLPAGTPAALRAVVLRCLEKAPERRFPSAAALAAALDAALTDLGRGPRRRAPGVALAAAAVAALLLVAFALPRRAPPPPPPQPPPRLSPEQRARALIADAKRLAAADRTRDAIAALTSALELLPDDRAALDALARTRIAWGEISEERAVIARLGRLVPDAPIVLAFHAFETGDVASVRGLFAQHPDDMDLALCLVFAYESAGDGPGALAACEELFARGPDRANVHAIRASAYRCGGRLSEAIAEASAAIARDPSCCFAWCERAIARSLRGDYTSAEADYAQVRRLEPTSEAAQLGHAILCFHRGDAARAKEELDAIIASRPDDGVALRFRAASERLLRLDAAAKRDIARALELRPRDRETLHEAAIILHVVLAPGEEVVALDIAGALAGLDPNDAAADVLTADVLERQGDRPGAIGCLENASAKLNPEAPIRAEIEKRLANLKARAH